MEIAVDVKDVRKLVKLDVDESHTIGQVIDEIVESLNLPKDKRYMLASGSKSLGPENYSARISELAPSRERRLLLVSEPTVVPVAPSPYRREKIDRRKYLKATGVAMVAGVGLAAGYLALPFLKPPTELGIQPLPVTSIVTRTVTETTTPSTSSPGTTTEITSSRTTTTGLPTVTDLSNFVVTRELPNSMEFTVDYAYGPDKQPTQFSNRPVELHAEPMDLPYRPAQTTGIAQALCAPFKCDERARRGRASFDLELCRFAAAPMSAETKEIEMSMVAESRPNEDLAFRTFFRKRFSYLKNWRDMNACPIM
jgi:hypothetical protein